MSEVQINETGAQRSNGLGTAALVLGIIGLVLAFIPFLNYGSGVIPFVGLILGIVALAKKNVKKTVALVGTVLSAVAVILSIVMAVAYTGLFFHAVDQSVQQVNEENNTPVSVVYDVTGASADATVTYSSYSNGNSGTEQASGQALPFTKTVTGTKGWSGYTLTATNGLNDAGDISCKITVDGSVVAEQTSTGKFATVTCSSSMGNASSN